MTEPTCGAAAVLRPGGPVRVPFRPCCAAALLLAAQIPGPGKSAGQEGVACPHEVASLPDMAPLAGEVRP
ncbi:hypothetical protein ACFQFC_22265 [Amorphoplanes digitatis]|uniref:Uncharacterized protein n=1 Tax=Actinoplanes digitatis TaxID=1868 RepID=A0A7W7MU08_9ACTN|nr:hypothetical protein [Actinoplanes digitatis]MBB4766943.1 hypothetical protein [Actinoplanes digitatis]BFE77182.1 hypothetical protein GCM10020092_104830 [Actinoplanes digitatis]